MEYNERVLEHFFTPRNIGKIHDADAEATVGDPACGDFIKVWIKVKDDVIEDFKYKVFGCAAAIATTSVVSVLVIGKSIKQALEYTDDDVVAFLGGLPSGKKHCSLLGIRGLYAVLHDVEIKKNHEKYTKRVDLYRSKGYDIPQARVELVNHIASIPKSEQILDVGTGKGHLAIALAKAGYSCVSIDLSSEEQHFARLNAEYFNVQDHIDLRTMNANKMDFPSHSFKGVMTADLLHHLTDPEPALSEMLRVCQPHGFLLLADLSERGHQIVSDVHKSEGRTHHNLGWSLQEVQKWFQKNGYHVERFDKDCEIILLIKSG